MSARSASSSSQCTCDVIILSSSVFLTHDSHRCCRSNESLNFEVSLLWCRERGESSFVSVILRLQMAHTWKIKAHTLTTFAFQVIRQKCFPIKKDWLELLASQPQMSWKTRLHFFLSHVIALTDPDSLSLPFLLRLSILGFLISKVLQSSQEFFDGNTVAHVGSLFFFRSSPHLRFDFWMCVSCDPSLVPFFTPISDRFRQPWNLRSSLKKNAKKRGE